MTLSDLILKKATPEQTVQTWKNTVEYWGKGINEEDYLKREKLLATQNFTSENLTPWVLVPKDNPETLDLLSHSESFNRKAYYRHPVNGVSEITVHSIASVFTNEAYRGKGYASIMFNQLVKYLSEDGALASILYSDVGSFYEKFGYQLFSSYQLEISAQENSVPLNPEVKYLNENQIQEISKWDCNKIREELEALSSEKLSKNGAFIVQPTFDAYLWHWARAKFYANYQGRETPTIYGAIYQDKDSNKDPEFLVWSYDFVENHLMVLRHRFQSHGHDLLAHALEHAKSMKLKKIVAWNLSFDVVKGKELGNISKWIERKDSLPYAVFPTFQKSEEPEWLEIQKYTWV